MPGSTIVPSPITAALAPIAGTSWGLYAGQNAGAGGEVKADGDAARGAAAPAADPVAVQIPTFAPAGGVGGGELLDLNELFGDELNLPDFMSELAQGLEDDGEELGSMGSAEAHSTSSPSPPVRETRYSTRGGSGASTTAPARDSPPERDDDDSLAIGRRRKKAKLTMKPLTEAQRVERRERNREHAKRSRMRKKFMLESLQAQMLALRKENLRLRQVVSSRIPDSAEHILSTCSSIRSAAALSTVELGHHRALVDSDTRLIRALQFSQQNFTISDPSLPDNPIVYASEGFLKLTGYTSGEVLGRNCRFLQGPGTDPAAVDIIRKGITNGDDTSVCLLNYRKDGTPFWNQFFVAVLRDSDGNIVNFVGVQCEVPDANMEDELKERVRTINFEDYDEDG